MIKLPSYKKIHCHTDIVRAVKKKLLKPHLKPDGLWYACGGEWIEFCINNGMQDEWNFVHEIDIDYTKILLIDTPNKVFEFYNKYKTPNKFKDPVRIIPSDNVHMIRWEEVVQDGYHGIEFAPFFTEKELGQYLAWYNSLDIASGCIWNPAAIKSIEYIGKIEDFMI